MKNVFYKFNKKQLIYSFLLLIVATYNLSTEKLFFKNNETAETIFHAVLENENQKIPERSKWYIYKKVDPIFISHPNQESGYWETLDDSKVSGKNIAIILHGFGNGVHKRLDIANLIYNLDLDKTKKNYDAIIAYEYHSIASIREISLEFSKALIHKLADNAHIDLYGHSMGGLVARWVAEKTNISFPVGRVISFCTPNQGIPIHLKSFLQGLIHMYINHVSPIIDAGHLRFHHHQRSLAISIPIMLSKTLNQWDPFCILRNKHSCAVFDVSTESIGSKKSQFLTDLNQTESQSSNTATSSTTYYTIAGTSLHTLGHKLMNSLFYQPWGIINDGIIPVDSAHIYSPSKKEICKNIKNNYFNIIMPLRHGLVCEKNTPIDKFQGLKDLMTIIMETTNKSSRIAKQKQLIAKKEDKRQIVEYLLENYYK